MAVYLVRHASAGTRDDADPEDGERILDPTGHQQAGRLADWLQHEAVGRIVTSPYRRCIQTVEPLAAVLGLDPDVDARLAEGSDVQSSWSLLEEVASLDADAVLCSHGDVIPGLVRRLQGRGMQIPGKSGCAKGSAWVLQHWDGSTFASGLYTPVKV